MKLNKNLSIVGSMDDLQANIMKMASYIYSVDSSYASNN